MCLMIVHMIVAGVFVLCLIATARLTRLVTTDRIMTPFRRWVVNKYGEDSETAYLVHCRYCASIWVATPVSLIWAVSTLPWQWWWLAGPSLLAMSYVTGLASGLEEEA